MSSKIVVATELYIRKCIDLAEQSVESGEAPFGSLIVRDNEIIATATNATEANHDVNSHAEIIAMRLAEEKFGKNLSGCEIYSNCEPCPMCAFMIRELGFSKVVYGVKSPNMGGQSRWNILEDETLLTFLHHPVPEIIGGVLAKECRATFTKIGWGGFLLK
jgi:tRNA(adenine34) deaminase